MIFDRRMFAQFDWVLLGLCLAVPMLGLVVLYSAGRDPDTAIAIVSWLPIRVESVAFVKQLLFLCIGLAVMLAAMAVPPQILARYAYPFYIVCLLLLLAVLIIGKQSHGARRWFDLGALHFQPSELMKLALILALSRYMSRNLPPPGGYGFRSLVVPFGLFALPMALIMRQPDLGTALCLGGVGFAMVLFMGIRLRSLFFMFMALVLAAVPIWKFMLAPYQQRRVLVLFNPEFDPQGSGYHIIQSKIAVGSGALVGKGYLQGTQSQLEFLPEHTTDFIFSVLAEEWGFVGCLVVLIVYFCFLYRMLQAVARSKDMFSALVVFGVTALIFFHVVVNVGMVIGILPVVGVPLMLVSYGGSSLVVTMFLVGLVLGLNMRRLLFTGKP